MYLIINIIYLSICKLLIIRVIITSEDNGFLFIPLDFALFYQLFFLCTDAFQKDGSRFVIWGLN